MAHSLNDISALDLRYLHRQQQQQQQQQEIQNCIASLRKGRDYGKKFVPPCPPSPDLLLPPVTLEDETIIRAHARAAAIAALARERHYKIQCYKEAHPEEQGAIPISALDEQEEERRREEEDRKVEIERRKGREEHWRFCRWQQHRIRRRGGTLSPNSLRQLGRGGARRVDHHLQKQPATSSQEPTMTAAPLEPRPPPVPTEDDQFTHTFAQHFVERLLHEDVRKNLEASSLRVAFCRNGGSWFDEALANIRHESQYLKFTTGGGPQTARVAQRSPSSRDQKRDTTPPAKRDAFMTEAQGSPQDQRHSKRGLRKGANDEDPWTTIVSLHDLRDVDCIETCIAKMHYNAWRGTRAEEEKFARLIPLNSLQFTLIAELIGASNEEFRRMVEYRPQDTEARQRESIKKHNKMKIGSQKDANMAEDLDVSSPNVLQHSKFRQLLRAEANQLFRRGAEEMERWNEDRDRMHTMKFESMSLDAMGGGWARTIVRIREAMSSSLEGEFATERKNLQTEFFERFSAAMRSKLQKAVVQLSSEGEQLLTTIQAALQGDKPFGGSEMQKIVEDLGINAFVLTDVTSILYSLGGALAIPQQHWLYVIKKKTEFLDPSAKVKAKMNLLDDIDHRSIRWVLRLAPSQVGPGLIRWVLSPHIAQALRPDERERFLTMLPLPEYAEALVATNPSDVHEDVLDYFDRFVEHRINQMKELREYDAKLHDKFIKWLKRKPKGRMFSV